MDVTKRIELTRRGNILIYFAQNTKTCGVTKANKLIYYLDCYHLFEYGRTVTRDTYNKLPEGPVPSDTYRRMTAIREMTNPQEGLSRDITENFKEFLFDFIDIKVEKISEGYDLYKIIPKKDFQSKWFSKSELEILSKVALELKYTTAKVLSEKTHKESPYKEAEDTDKVDITLYLKDKGLSHEKINEVKDIENTIRSMEINYHCRSHGILQPS